MPRPPRKKKDFESRIVHEFKETVSRLTQVHVGRFTQPPQTLAEWGNIVDHAERAMRDKHPWPAKLTVIAAAAKGMRDGLAAAFAKLAPVEPEAAPAAAAE